MAKQKAEKKQHKSEVNIKSISVGNRQRFYSVLVFVFPLLLYFNSVFNDYNMDDELVTQNHRLTSKGISAIPEIFSSPYYEDKGGYKYEYRPIVLVSFAIENSLFGEHAWISHLINVLLYALLCLLLFEVLRKLLRNYSILFPVLISLVFASYPLHTEVVTSIKNRDEILALFFGLLSLYCALQFTLKKGVGYLLTSCLFFLLGILSKTTTITFILLIPATLVLLSEVSFGYLMLVTITLAIPAVFFARLYSATQQVGLFVLLLLASVALYSFKNYKQALISIHKFSSQILSLFETKQESLPEIQDSLDFTFLKNKFALASLIASVVIAVMISSLGVYYGISWMASIPFLGLAAFFIIGRKEIKLLLIVPITLMAIFSIVKVHFFATSIESALLAFLGGIILYRDRAFKIAGIGMLLLLAVISVTLNHSFYFLASLLFVVMLNKRTYWLSYLGAAIFLAFYVKFLLSYNTLYKGFDISLVSLPIVILGIVLIWAKKNNWVIRFAVVIIPLLIGVYFMTSSGSQLKVANILQRKYSQINKVRATDLTPVQTVRPFNYIEIPIVQSDPPSIKYGTAMLVLGKYLKLILIPYPMSFYYGYSYISPVPITATIPILSLWAYISLFVVALFFFRRSPLVAFSILFFLISISVFSNLFVQVPGMMGDRFLFIPSIGFCFLLVFILSKIFKQNLDATIDWKELKTPMKTSLAVILVLYSLLTFSRNMDWKDRITLFSHDIKVVENSAQAQNLLGLHLMLASNRETDAVKQKQMREESLLHFKRAVEIYPNFLNATFDRARLLESLQRYDEALVAYKEATQLDTTFTTPYFAMGIIYQNKGNEKEASECYEKYLPKHPLQMEIYANLSYSYFKQQLFDKSISTNQRAISVNPTAVDPYINIGKTYMQTNQRDSAIIYFQKALQVKPGDANLIAIINQIRAGK